MNVEWAKGSSSAKAAWVPQAWAFPPTVSRALRGQDYAPSIGWCVFFLIVNISGFKEVLSKEMENGKFTLC